MTCWQCFAWEAVGLLRCQGTLLAHGQLVDQVFPCGAAFQLAPQHVLVQGVVPPWGEGLCAFLGELHVVPVGPFLQLPKVPLDGSMVSRVPAASPSLVSCADFVLFPSHWITVLFLLGRCSFNLSPSHISSLPLKGEARSRFTFTCISPE